MKAIKIALKKLPKGSDAYDDAYKEAMERIKCQITDLQELAYQVLSWIICAKRPLTTLELQHALAVEVGEPQLDEQNLPGLEDMVSVCAGLVTIDEESDIIRLVHYTTQEYFERTQESWFPNAETYITATCITYLSFDVFAIGFAPTDEEFKERLQVNTLYDYAARNWGYHASTASTELNQPIMEHLIRDFLKSEAKVSASIQAMMASGKYRGFSQRVPQKMTGVHLAAYFGLKEVIETLLKNSHHLDSKNSYGRTPLSWAAKYGHKEVVKLLLTIDSVKPDSIDNSGRTPLSYAAEGGHEVVVVKIYRQSIRHEGFKSIVLMVTL
jgi:hypothetical protein